MAERSRSRSAPSRASSIRSAELHPLDGDGGLIGQRRRAGAARRSVSSRPAARRRRRSRRRRRGWCGSARTAAARRARCRCRARPAGRRPTPSGRRRGRPRRASSGGKAARGRACPRRGSRITTSTFEHRGDLGDDDPQQVVEVDDAGDLAAEGIELGGGARLAPRRLGLRRARAASALAATATSMKKNKRDDVGRIGDGEVVERRQEEEVVGERRSARRPERRHRGHSAPPPPAPARHEDQRDVGQRRCSWSISMPTPVASAVVSDARESRARASRGALSSRCGRRRRLRRRRPPAPPGRRCPGRCAPARRPPSRGAIRTSASARDLPTTICVALCGVR